ncbi:alpha/beta fold hydrolase [Anaerolineales bacterium HSG24]|nr:alpha/beta fold hydrolase [Anaerolineales bacterium HSG24]
MKKTTLYLLILTIFLLACNTLLSDDTSPEASNAPVSTSSEVGYQPRACPFDVKASDATIECGYLTVPENRSKADHVMIELAVAILRASGSEVAPDPIIYLEGGPGGSALDSFSSDLETWLDHPFQQDHDLIFIDQRGTGYSHPTLDCPENEAYDDEIEALTTCRDRLLDEGIDLTAYNSIENAADVVTLWQTLGYEQVNLYGISYGTRLGLAIMRDHPAQVRSVVLDSPFPPNIDTPIQDSFANLSTFQKLFQGCANDSACNEAYPNLEDIFLKTVIRLDNEPGVANLYDWNEDEYYEAEVTGYDLMGTLVQAMYDVYTIPMLPRMIYDTANDDFEAYSLVIDYTGYRRMPVRQSVEDVSDSEGMFHSVTCRDEYSYTAYETVEQKIVSQAPTALQENLLYDSSSMFESCELWGAGQAPAYADEAVVSDIPTLILTGEYDPVTPTSWGELALETLENGYLYEFRGFGHAVSSEPGCAADMMTEFFSNPTVAPNSDCLQDIPNPNFILPNEELEN